MSSINEQEPMMPVAIAKILGVTTEYEGLRPQQIYSWIKRGLIKPTSGSMTTIADVKVAFQQNEEQRHERSTRQPSSGGKKNNSSAEIDRVDLKGVGIGSLISYCAGVQVRPLQHLKWQSNMLVHTEDVDGKDVHWNKRALNDAIADGTVTVENPVKVLKLLAKVIEQGWPGKGVELEKWIAKNEKHFDETPAANSIVNSFPDEVKDALKIA